MPNEKSKTEPTPPCTCVELPAGLTSRMPAAQGEYPISPESASPCAGKYFNPSAPRAWTIAPISLFDVDGSPVFRESTKFAAPPSDRYGNRDALGMKTPKLIG